MKLRVFLNSIKLNVLYLKRLKNRVKHKETHHKVLSSEIFVKGAISYSSTLQHNNFAFMYIIESSKKCIYTLTINVSTILCILVAFGTYIDLSCINDCSLLAEEKLKALINNDVTIHIEKNEEKMMENFKLRLFISRLLALREKESEQENKVVIKEKSDTNFLINNTMLAIFDDNFEDQSEEMTDRLNSTSKVAKSKSIPIMNKEFNFHDVSSEIKTPRILFSKYKSFCSLFRLNSKYLETKDIIDIAVSYRVLNKNKLVELISILYNKKDSGNENELLFPISLYKTLVLHEDFETFSELRNSEKKFSKSLIIELCKHSIACSSPMFTLYFSKNIKIGRSKLINEIINQLLVSFDTSSNLHLYFEEKLYFVEYLLQYFTYDESKCFNDIIHKFLSKEGASYLFVEEEKMKKQDVINSPLLFHPNPVKILVLIANILKHLNTVFDAVQSPFV